MDNGVEQAQLDHDSYVFRRNISTFNDSRYPPAPVKPHRKPLPFRVVADKHDFKPIILTQHDEPAFVVARRNFAEHDPPIISASGRNGLPKNGGRDRYEAQFPDAKPRLSTPSSPQSKELPKSNSVDQVEASITFSDDENEPADKGVGGDGESLPPRKRSAEETQLVSFRHTFEPDQRRRESSTGTGMPLTSMNATRAPALVDNSNHRHQSVDFSNEQRRKSTTPLKSRLNGSLLSFFGGGGNSNGAERKLEISAPQPPRTEILAAERSRWFYDVGGNSAAALARAGNPEGRPEVQAEENGKMGPQNDWNRKSAASVGSTSTLVDESGTANQYGNGKDAAAVVAEPGGSSPPTPTPPASNEELSSAESQLRGMISSATRPPIISNGSPLKSPPPHNNNKVSNAPPPPKNELKLNEFGGFEVPLQKVKVNNGVTLNAPRVNITNGQPMTKPPPPPPAHKEFKALPVPKEIPELKLNGFVGFDSLPYQIVQKCKSNGFNFNLMCVGEVGLGKTTLIESLFNRKIEFDPIERSANTVELLSKTCEIYESGVRVNLRVIETAGFGEKMDNEKSAKIIVDYINSQFEAYLREELKVYRRLNYYDDTRIHACLYFINSNGHGLKPLDVVTMRELARRVNVIPVIAKADTACKDELVRIKQRIMNEIRANNIDVYQFPTDDEAVRQENEALNALLPFAIVGSVDFVTKEDGRTVRARKYPWGIVEVENEEHCDFVKLREAMLRINEDSLRERTHSLLYERYRRQRLQEMKLRDGDAGPKMAEASIMRQKELQEENRRRDEKFQEEFLQRLAKKEAELKHREEALRFGQETMRNAFSEELQKLNDQISMLTEERSRLINGTLHNGSGGGKKRK